MLLRLLRALRTATKQRSLQAVTAAQILQMVVGVTVQCAAMRANCGVDPANLVAGGVMYFTYLLLFVKFAVDRFVTKRFRRSEVVAAVSGQAPSKEPIVDAFPLLSYFVKTLRKAASSPKLASV